MSGLFRGALIVKHNAHPTQTAERVAAKLKERGVPKVHPASEFAGTAPDDGVADDLALLTEGRAKKINEAGPLPGEGTISGNPATWNATDDAATIRGRQGQNYAAKKLKDAGYKVKRLDEPPGVPSNDHQIGNVEFDCITPSNTLTGDVAAKVWGKVKDKVVAGKSRVVVNLDGADGTDACPVNINDLRAFAEQTPIPGLEDVIVLQGGQVVPFWQHLK